jgi:hypothetical protein
VLPVSWPSRATTPALRLGPVDAEFSDGGVDAALFAPAALGNRRKLRRFIVLSSELYPLGYVVGPLLHR